MSDITKYAVLYISITCSTIICVRFGPHLKQALLFDKCPPLQCPEIQVGFSTSHNDICVCGMEICCEHRLIGALQVGERRMRKSRKEQEKHLYCCTICCRQLVMIPCTPAIKKDRNDIVEPH